MRTPETTKASDGNRGPSENHRLRQDRPAHHTGTPPDVDVLLSRLERVRRAGKGWTAKCPAHADRNASLSVAVADDGKILVHCFAMCSIGDILVAVGLTLSDIFPRRIADMSPLSRREASEFARQAQWRAALGVLALEATIVVIAANELREGRTLPADDEARLVLARDRIVDARSVLT